MIMNRVWAMPNSRTFKIKPIKEVIKKYEDKLKDGDLVIDPFSNENTITDRDRLVLKTNDIDPQYETDYSLDALDFLKVFDEGSVDLVLYDPPYSPRQVSEVYKKMGMSVNMQTTQASYWGNQKKEISRIVKVGGYVMTFGWNSGGIGKTKGFEIVEILMVAHGGWHNDTIVTVEKKVKLGGECLMELNKIYNEDCLEGMKKMLDKSVDMILTSPPYDN